MNELHITITYANAFVTALCITFGTVIGSFLGGMVIGLFK